MRGRAFISLALRNIPRNHGWIAFPPYPLARIAAASSARLRTILTLERAHTRPYTAWRKRQAALRRRVASLISGRLRGTFPLGLPECIRQTPLPCVRGPDRAPRLCRGGCWLAALCLGVLQQPQANPFQRQPTAPPAPGADTRAVRLGWDGGGRWKRKKRQLLVE